MSQLPADFITQITQLLGADEASALCTALTGSEAPVSIRRNPLKPVETLPEAEVGAVLWCDAGCYLAARPRFTYDPLLHAGCYYVQEAASMFVEQAYRRIVADFQPHRLLDLCAAPGGKSTLWRSLLPAEHLLVANEPIRQRAQILAENLAKWGHPDTVVTSAYPAEYAGLGSFFDVVAADVPCSGEGMFRKDENARTEWSLQAVADCAERQWQIISDIWPTLRQGGYLVYSTCTYNRAENEDNVYRICRELGAETVELPVPTEWKISGDTTGRNLHVYHFFPHRTQGEGLFLSLLRKTAEAPVMKEKKRKRGSESSSAVKNAAAAARWIQPAEQFKLLPVGEGQLAAVRQSLVADVRSITETVRALTVGVPLAEEKGRKLIPQHHLALSAALNREAFPTVELSLEQALSYLRREALCLPAEAPRGYVLITYQNHPLGFANNLGTRANNLYPQEWRIRN